MEFSQQNINQSGTEIGDKKLPSGADVYKWSLRGHSTLYTIPEADPQK